MGTPNALFDKKLKRLLFPIPLNKVSAGFVLSFCICSPRVKLVSNIFNNAGYCIFTLLLNVLTPVNVCGFLLSNATLVDKYESCIEFAGKVIVAPVSTINSSNTSTVLATIFVE